MGYSKLDSEFGTWNSELGNENQTPSSEFQAPFWTIDQQTGKVTPLEQALTGQAAAFTAGLDLNPAPFVGCASREDISADKRCGVKGNSLENVSAIRQLADSANGRWSIDENGKLTVKEIETEKIKTEKGVTTRDKTTGEYYCIMVDSGAVLSIKGECN